MDSDKKSVMGSRAAGIIVGFAISMLGACAVLDARPPEAVVKERAEQRWDALVQGDIKAAYEFLSPGSRATNSLEAYTLSIRVGFFKKAEVEKVVCEKPDVCDVHMAIEYEYRGSRVRTPLKDTWIKEGSSWWFVQK